MPVSECPRCRRKPHSDGVGGCPLNYLDPPGFTFVVPADGLVPGTGCCQVCRRVDQALYVTRGGTRHATTMASMCKGCAHSLCIQLLEFLCL